MTEVTDRLRAVIAENPRHMPPVLARQFGVPEVEVLRVYPPGKAVELDLSRWRELIESFEELGLVHIIIASGAAKLYGQGRFGQFNTFGDYITVQTESLDMYIRWGELKTAFAVERIGFRSGEPTLSFQLFDQAGTAAFKVYLNFSAPPTAEQTARFAELRDRFRRSTG
jgi:putative heme iron utilization protein